MVISAALVIGGTLYKKNKIGDLLNEVFRLF